MYSYTFDVETGVILLNSTPTNFSKEPRPVYAAEMDILGFDQYWEYDKQNDIPYMWAESTAYWYRGVKIATITGGDLYTAPTLQPMINENGKIFFNKESGDSLLPIDIVSMCNKNSDLMTVIEDSTVKRIVKEYEKFQKRLDIFHVAFSGGKDSAVLLDLVKKALPKGSFVVIFGDTGMEFPDTYETIEVTRKQCELDKFVEACNLDKEFHLSYLFDESVERDGVSPVRMFGLYDEDELKSKLIGLSSAYPEFINATFTNDLKTITLCDKTSADVLELFKEDV